MNLWLGCLPLIQLAVVALLLPTPAFSQNALRGKALYSNTNGAPMSCANADCHTPDPTRDVNNILDGANDANAIRDAIVEVPVMRFLSAYVNDQDRLDLAAYLANPGVMPAPAIAVTPGSLSFASTFVGSVSGVSAITIRNAGSANLVLTSIGIAGAAAAEFRIETSTTCSSGASIVPSASCRIDLTFRPTSAGAKAASVVLAHNAAGGSTSIPLAASSTLPPAPTIALSPGAITFPAAVAGTISAVHSVTAANNGTAALSFSAISLAGPSAGEFRIEPSSTCAVTSGVPAGSSCRIDLTYRPTVLGSASAALNFAHNASAGLAAVALNGSATAAPAPTLSVSAASQSFPAQEVGTQGASQTITLTNVGTSGLTISALTAGGSHAGDFPRTGSCQAGLTLSANGGACTLVHAFAPTAVGARSATVAIQSNNSAGTVTLSLAGTGTTNIPAAVASPASVAFGPQQIGTSSTAQSVLVSNGGGGLLAVAGVSLASSHFNQSSTCIGASLAAGQSCTVSVVFAPAASGPVAATLSIAISAVGSPLTVALSGVGSTTPIPVIGATPAALAFPGVTVVGQPSPPQRVAITNAGPGSLTLGAITTNSGEFVLTGTGAGVCAAGQALAPSASCAVDVQFSPSAPGDRTGTLNVASDGSPSTLSVALSGQAAGVGAPVISSDRTALEFGRIVLSSSSPPQFVLITNVGTTNLAVSAMSIDSPFGAAPGGTCSQAPFVLSPGQACALAVQVTPASAGLHTGTLSVSSNAGTLTIGLSAEAIGAQQAPNASAGASVAPSNAGGGGAASATVLLLLLVVSAFVTRSHWDDGQRPWHPRPRRD